MGLSQRGHDQAAALAGWLRNRRFDAVYASPMQRVQLTLAPFRQHHPGEPVLLEGLREVDFGAWTGFGWNEVEEKFGVSASTSAGAHRTRPDPSGRTHRALPPTRGPVRPLRPRTQPRHHRRRVRSWRSDPHGPCPSCSACNAEVQRFEIDYASVSWLDIGELKAGRPPHRNPAPELHPMARSMKHPLRQVAVATNADAEDAVFASPERILEVAPRHPYRRPDRRRHGLDVLPASRRQGRAPARRDPRRPRRIGGLRRGSHPGPRRHPQGPGPRLVRVVEAPLSSRSASGASCW